MHQEAAVLDPALIRDVEAAIKASEPEWQKFVAANRVPAFEGDTLRRPLAMKYVPSDRAKGYLPAPGQSPFDPPNTFPKSPPTKGIFIGNKDYTWGKAVYVTGIHESLSTATYGRVGLVSYFEPTEKWRVFDARDQDNYLVYLKWLQCQPLYPRALLTVHTNHWLHGLRNAFRTQFRIDVVMCSPDEQDVGLWYTDPADTWLCVSDFEPDKQNPKQERLKDNFSKVFPDVRMTVVIEEEFVVPNDPKIPLPRPPAWPLSRVRQLAVSGKAPGTPSVHDIAQAYWQGQIFRVPS